MLGEEKVWEFGNVANVNPPNKKRHKKTNGHPKNRGFFWYGDLYDSKKTESQMVRSLFWILGVPRNFYVCVCVCLCVCVCVHFTYGGSF